ncbi:hypothetical protein C8J55DRAFT_420527 [Lentinula edodes]|uniref:Hyaluronan/mRNA-binding protein domain-containing protein n=1 Tax=Lentinula lateritia TaxID=40482 RepID=A0A9W9AW17_9AGAR|nr:hypothetical protein C8J55DRAFT_420527 [Lentinula edodes]
MTRTARAAFPRAIIKDRSQSRSGFSKEMKKGGAGSHNWGKLGEIENENELEYDSEGDSAQMTRSSVNDGGFFFAPCLLTIDCPEIPTPRKRSTSFPNESEIEAAKQLRKNALNDGVDLATIARTSVAVSSSPKDTITATSDASVSHSNIVPRKLTPIDSHCLAD